MQIEDEHIGIRLEDILVVGDLSAFVPIEIRDVEQLMARRV